MAGPILIAGDVMDACASLQNDTAKSIYTYTKQLPYLNIAMRELQEYYELNQVAINETLSTIITVPNGIGEIGFAPVTPVPNTPYLPDDLIEPQILWERPSGIDPFIPMHKQDFLPEYMRGTQLTQFIYYVWETQKIKVLPAIQDNDIKMNYTRSLFITVTSPTTVIPVLNAASFLSYRTAGLCAEFIGENKTRADSLNGDASLAMDRVLGIGAKGRQAIITRHRPFRSSYKRRSYM